jgi:hypothetical protein
MTSSTISLFLLLIWVNFDDGDVAAEENVTDEESFIFTITIYFIHWLYRFRFIYNYEFPSYYSYITEGSTPCTLNLSTISYPG